MSNKVDNIVSELKWKINCGIYDHSNKLPSENAIAIQSNCSRLTARKALQILKNDGLIISEKSRGYFVSPKYQKLQYTTKHGLCPTKNDVYEIKDINDTYIHNIFKELGFDFKKYKNKSFSFLKIQNTMKEKPFTILHSFLNLNIFKEIELKEVQDSLAMFFSKSGVKVKKRIEKILIIKPPMYVQEKLNIMEGKRVVASYSVMLTSENKIIEMAVRYTTLSEYAETFEREY